MLNQSAANKAAVTKETSPTPCAIVALFLLLYEIYSFNCSV